MFNTLLHAFYAIAYGLKICLRDATTRKLAVIPWCIGMFCYVASLFGAYYAHAPILHWMVSPPEHWWNYFLYAAAWIFVALLLLLATCIVSITFVLILAGPFHTAIAERILTLQGISIAAPTTGIIREAGRTIVTELIKLIWLVPLIVMAVILGFIPLLTPFALLASAWLLAYQFIDIPLDALRLPAMKRFRYCTRHLSATIAFGLVLSLLWAIPFLGILLAPAAAAAAAWLVAKIGVDPLPHSEQQAPAETLQSSHAISDDHTVKR